MISVDVRQFNVDQQQNLKDRLDSLSVQIYNLTHSHSFLPLWGVLYAQKHHPDPNLPPTLTSTRSRPSTPRHQLLSALTPSHIITLLPFLSDSLLNSEMCCKSFAALSSTSRLSFLSLRCNRSHNIGEAEAGAPCFPPPQLQGSGVNAPTLPCPACGKQTHLLFGLALSLSDVRGDNSLRLFPQSRK